MQFGTFGLAQHAAAHSAAVVIVGLVRLTSVGLSFGCTNTQAKGANSVTQSDFLCANPLLDEWHSWLECSGNTQRTLQKWPPKSPSGILHALVSDDSSAPISCAQCSAVYHRAVKSVAGWVGPVITWAAGWSRGCSMGACVGA